MISETASILQFHDVSFGYETRRVLEGVNLSIGPSGVRQCHRPQWRRKDNSSQAGSGIAYPPRGTGAPFRSLSGGKSLSSRIHTPTRSFRSGLSHIRAGCSAYGKAPGQDLGRIFPERIWKRPEKPWNRYVSTTWSIDLSGLFREDSSSGFLSPGLSAAIRNSSCWTSPPPTWIPIRPESRFCTFFGS